MVNNPKALWDNCLSLIKDNVTEQQYKTWLGAVLCELAEQGADTLLRTEGPAELSCRY